MSIFDHSNEGAENRFIRHSPAMLEQIFGSTEVTPFWVADMDFRIADPIKHELQRLVDRAQFAYEFDSETVFAAICGWYQRRHGLALDTKHFLQVTGVLTGIALLVRELTAEGEGVLIQTPAYHQFAKVIRTAQRRVVKSPLRVVGARYQMDFEDLDRKLSDLEVKVMILCNPHNPVGRVWVEDELRQLLDIAREHDVTVVSDEIHSDIIYPGHRFTSLMALDADHHAALIGSPAKTFGMQSISNGYVYTANTKLLAAIRRVVDSMYLGHGNALTTFATIAAYQKGEEWLDELLTYLQGTVEWIAEFLQEKIPSVTMSPAEGTYQIWLDFSATGLAGDGLVTVLSDAGFGATPGTWFDRDATQFARMNIAAPRAKIAAAFERLHTVLDCKG